MTAQVNRYVKGRPRSTAADRAILEAFREVLSEQGFADLRLEHVATRAGVGKSTLYRRWPSKEALAQRLLAELAGPHNRDRGDRRHAPGAAGRRRQPHAGSDGHSVRPGHPSAAFADRDQPKARRPVQARSRGRAADGDRASRPARHRARRSAHRRRIQSCAIDLLVGPVYFRVMFGGDLDLEFANRVVDAYLAAFATSERR